MYRTSTSAGLPGFAEPANEISTTIPKFLRRVFLMIVTWSPMDSPVCQQAGTTSARNSGDLAIGGMAESSTASAFCGATEDDILKQVDTTSFIQYMKKLKTVEDLSRMANTVRKDIIKMLVEAGSGHTAGPLGLADVATALYFHVLNVSPQTRHDPDRDRLYISAGHYAPVWYAVLARAGYFPVEELKTLRKLGTRLQGHVDRLTVPGVESTAASLGQGLSIACGCAYAGKLDKKTYQTYVVLSDGEHDEGSIWEAVSFAGHYRLSRLTAIVDRNNIQIDGFTEDVMKKDPLMDKYEAFGWHGIEVDGNNIESFIDACNEAKAIHELPVCIIAHTIPGKGVDFMENDYRWHGSPPGQVQTERTPPAAEQAKEALRQLDEIGKQLGSSVM